FWFWDPVENASFMPWLFATALLHSAIVVEKRETLKAWTILLSILGFGFSLMGTFIVRSGVITSVHAFASDPERGVFILMIFAVFVGGALTLFAFRSAALEAKGVFALVSRESALVLNNVLLAVASLVVFTGTMWPLVSELAFGRVLSVGAPFFDAAFTPFMVALAVVLPVGAVIPWKRGNLGRAVRSMWGVAVLAIALGALAFTLQTGRSALAPVGVALGTWLVLGALADLWQRSGRQGIGARLARMTRLPRADWGKALSHAGLGITIFAVSAVLGWSTEDIRVAQIGESFVHDGYTVTLTGVERVQGPNYISSMGHVTVERDGQLVAELAPEKRVYPAAGMPTTEAAIDYALIRDIYVALGDPQDGGGWALRTYVKPFASCLWLGVLIMALGGVASLSDRRYRMAAGARRAAAPQATPAE
ncbi:MAG: cytochrome c biogenesis protein CcsA, partial [Rhodobacteraceae bacterium]|nr:cytochrome c biogenesis protein CcsA [Paracoccaceae bacterium]